MICSGAGNVWLASCLAGAHSTAGIILSAIGWCHQMANRILRPAGIDVRAARGYGFTYHCWGKFGLDASSEDTWPELGHCLELEATAGLQEEGAPFLSGATPRGGSPSSAPERLDRMIDEHLGVDYDPAKRAQLGQLAAVFEPEQRNLVSAFQAKLLTPDQYLERFTRLVNDQFASYDRILGREDFVRLFGGPPEQALDCLDPEMFRRIHGSEN